MNDRWAQDASQDDATMEFAGRVTRYQGALFAYLGRMGCTPAVAEELAQEAFLRAWRYRDRYDPARGAWSTWLFSIAHHLTVRELGKARYRYVYEDAEETQQLADAESTQPFHRLADEQAQERLHAAIRQLPDADREALALSMVDELATREAARLCGCSGGAYRTRLTRARHKLRALLLGDTAMDDAGGATKSAASDDAGDTARKTSGKAAVNPAGDEP